MGQDVCRRTTARSRSGIASLASALLIVGCAKAPPDPPPSDPDPDPVAQVEAPAPVPETPPPGTPDADAVAAFARGAAAVKHSPYRPLDVVPDLEPEAHAAGLRDLQAAWTAGTRSRVGSSASTRSIGPSRRARRSRTLPLKRP